MDKIKIVIVDGRPIRRSRIRASLSKPDFDVLATTSAMEEAMVFVQTKQPDIIIASPECLNVNRGNTSATWGDEDDLFILPKHEVDGYLRGSGLTNSVRINLSDPETRLPDLIPQVAMHNALPPSEKVQSNHLVAIGASTGGVEAIQSILSALPANCPPILVVQHMRGQFLSVFANRLNNTCEPEVLEAWDSAPLQTGRVYIAPGSNAHLEIQGTTSLRCKLKEGPEVSGHRPSIDRLFSSLAECKALKRGILLTGMGKDGASGLLELRRSGAHTIAQDEASCVVYGMPKAAVALGSVVEQLPLTKIAAAIMKPVTPPFQPWETP